MFVRSCITGKSLPLAALVVSLSSVGFAQQSDLPQYSNKFAPYVVTPEHAVDRMLELANLKPGETLFDLGCGDGRILITAVQKYKVKAVGIEISDRLARSAAEKVKKGNKNLTDIVLKLTGLWLLGLDFLIAWTSRVLSIGKVLTTSANHMSRR